MIQNFGYVPPQKLKINLIFLMMANCCWRIHAVLLVYHLLILVRNIFFLYSTMVGIMCPGCFFMSSIILDRYGTNVYVPIGYPRTLQKFSHRKYSCHHRCLNDTVQKYAAIEQLLLPNQKEWWRVNPSVYWKESDNLSNTASKMIECTKVLFIPGKNCTNVPCQRKENKGKKNGGE